MATQQAGWTADGKGLLRSMVYAAFQELATRIAHRNTGLAVHDAAGERLLARIAADENLHMVFYRDLVAAALALAPHQALVAIADEVAHFRMPGSGTPGFLRHSVLIAEAGIYDARTHRDEVVAPLLQHWQVLSLPVADPAARTAQRDLLQRMDRLQEIVQRFEQRRALRQRGGGDRAEVQ
jgi:acyl-[acyl-carrier-protein] desaturase